MVNVNAGNLGLGSNLGKRYCTNDQSNNISNNNVNIKRLRLSNPTASTDKRFALQEDSFALETDNSGKPSETLLRNECPATNLYDRYHGVDAQSQTS